ncbi:helix-turn-helix domain-containing protein [Limnobacter parvus]|uniref:Helix-turn-helix domain-containing protein n=1 Tax=Limnobacter parvus TaxID=2939690 RepID=A0ABT1XJ35_9BURK|nr:helix-turn-helix transcriptional regulator [Limnobacter parvus]MCR2747297.1 helix-turn-helix domain-containing protein [Limnobacter parvus]
MANQQQVLVTSSQLGHILQTSRKAKRMSQSALASKLVLSQSRVSHLELHPEELSLNQLMNWCAVLGLELLVGVRGTHSNQAAKADW